MVVTAQKRSENLQNVPIAITAITADKLATANISSTAGLQAVTPAITFSNVNGFLEPRIRGIGSSSAGAAVENSVATYIDGVYIASAPGSLLDLSSIERVEVLKGPQGTLFGRNATGGLVSVITRDPKFSFSGSADAGYGDYDTSRVDAYGGGVNSCLALAVMQQGRSITTIAGLAKDGELHPVQAAFVGARRVPVRLLHARSDHERGGPASPRAMRAPTTRCASG